MLICCQQPRWQMEQFRLSLLLSWYIFFLPEKQLWCSATHSGGNCRDLCWQTEMTFTTITGNQLTAIQFVFWRFQRLCFFKTTYAFPFIYFLATRSVRLQCRLCMHCHPPLLICICSSLSSNHIIATDSLAAAAAHSQRLHPKEEWAK